MGPTVVNGGFSQSRRKRRSQVHEIYIRHNNLLKIPKNYLSFLFIFLASNYRQINTYFSIDKFTKKCLVFLSKFRGIFFMLDIVFKNCSNKSNNSNEFSMVLFNGVTGEFWQKNDNSECIVTTQQLFLHIFTCIYKVSFLRQRALSLKVKEQNKSIYRIIDTSQSGECSFK